MELICFDEDEKYFPDDGKAKSSRYKAWRVLRNEAY
jgi:hypothetical protein